MAAGKSCVKSRKGRGLGVAGKSRVEGRERGDGVEARIGGWCGGRREAGEALKTLDI